MSLLWILVWGYQIEHRDKIDKIHIECESIPIPQILRKWTYNIILQFLSLKVFIITKVLLHFIPNLRTNLIMFNILQQRKNCTFLLPHRTRILQHNLNNSISKIHKDNNQSKDNKIDIEYFYCIFRGCDAISACSRGLQCPK